MKKHIIISIIVFLSSCFTVSAQTDTTNLTKPSEEIFTVVEVMPEFPGGEQAMNDYIVKNIVYPKEAMNKGIEGKVYIQFVIDKEGNVTNAEVRKGVEGGCSEEALRVVKSMPRWKPGSLNGKPVMVKMYLPIHFVLR